jgi:hypothetical protein
MGDYMPDLSSLFSTTATPSTQAAKDMASSVPSWSLDASGTGGVPYTTATTPQDMSIFSAYAPTPDQMWKVLNSPIGMALFGKLLGTDKGQTPPPPPAPQPKAPTPFVQTPLQLSGGFQPLQIPSGGPHPGGMGGDMYDQLLAMLMKRGG